MNNKNISLNYYIQCIDNNKGKIERKYQDEKDQFFDDLQRNGGVGVIGRPQCGKKIIDIKKKLIKDIIYLMQECSIESLGKKSPKELTEKELDFIANKIDKDFRNYVNKNITSSDELKNDGNIAQYGLAKALQEIDEEAKVLIDNIKGKFELIKQEKEILKKKKKIENLDAIPRNFHEHEYGYGIYLSWKSLESDYVKYYQIQRSNNKDKWENCKEKIIDAESNPGYNDHGGIIHREKGKIYTNCLPSGKTFYYRVRTLDINREPISQWSNIEKGTVSKYPDNLTKDENELFYVDKTRIDEIKKIKNNNFDTKKLVKFCEELNICYSNECVFAIAMILRSILNHVPPIFNEANFEQVASNYNWGSSKKHLIIDLQKGLRKIADSYLHYPMRNKEALPKMVQVDFRTKLDVLLEEIVRILKDR